MAAARTIRFLPHLKEIRIHLCQKSDASKGVREFIERHYVQLKKTNPQTPILVRECSGILPKIYARHEKGAEVSATVTNLPAEEVFSVVETLAKN